MNEKYKFTIDKLVSIKEIIKDIEETNYIDGYLGYENDFYIDSILYYLKENARLKDERKQIKEYVEKCNFDNAEIIYDFGSEYCYIDDFKEHILEILEGGD